MGFASKILQELGPLAEYRTDLTTLESHARIKQDYYGKRLEIVSKGFAHLGKLPVGASMYWLDLDSSEISSLSAAFHALLRKHFDGSERQAGVFEASLRFRKNILSDQIISDRGSRLTRRRRVHLLAYSTETGAGYVLRFDFSHLIGFRRYPLELDEEEAKRFLKLLDRLISTRALEASPSDESFPLWKDVAVSLLSVLPGVLLSFILCPPFGILAAFAAMDGRKGRWIALLLTAALVLTLIGIAAVKIGAGG